MVYDQNSVIDAVIAVMCDDAADSRYLSADGEGNYTFSETNSVFGVFVGKNYGDTYSRLTLTRWALEYIALAEQE